MSLDPYHNAFKQPLDLRKFSLSKHPTAGLTLQTLGRVHLASMTPGSPAAKIPDWRPGIWGAWLIKVGNTTVSTIADVAAAIEAAIASGLSSFILLFAHLEIQPNLFHDGIPIVSLALFALTMHDQLNTRWEFSTVTDYLHNPPLAYSIVESRDVQNFVTQAMCLTRGKLLKQDDWTDWQEYEFLQLNQY